MKKLIPLILVFAIISCSDNSWTKDNLISKCKTAMQKEKAITTNLNAEMITKICECDADKLMAKYKSKSDADGDKEGVEKIGMDCALELMKDK